MATQQTTKNCALLVPSRNGEKFNGVDGVAQQKPEPQTGWQPPTPKPLGWTGLTDAEIKDHAQGWVG